MSGLPYLRKLSLDYFKISVILSFRVLKYGNIGQKSWKLNTRTFSFQASCVNEISDKTARFTIQQWCCLQTYCSPHSLAQRVSMVGEWPPTKTNMRAARACARPTLRPTTNAHTWDWIVHQSVVTVVSRTHRLQDTRALSVDDMPSSPRLTITGPRHANHAPPFVSRTKLDCWSRGVEHFESMIH